MSAYKKINCIIPYFIKYLFYLFNFRNVLIEYGAIISRHSQFEGKNKIGKNTRFVGLLGRGSYISQNAMIHAKIGRYTSIAENVETIIATHPLQKNVSTSPMFYSLLKQNGYTYSVIQRYNEFRYADVIDNFGVIIGNDVWIGTGVKIIGGVTIHDGAVILANAVVSKDVPPYAIVGGVPAKTLKYRFSDIQIITLLNIKWWDKDEEWLIEHCDLFDNIDEFIKNV